jgi:hypothetical protein
MELGHQGRAINQGFQVVAICVRADHGTFEARLGWELALKRKVNKPFIF